MGQKQLHTLNNHYLEVGTSYYNTHLGQIIGNKILNDMIYNLRKPLKYKSPKSPSKYISLRDQYMLKDTESKLYKFHKAGMDNMKRRLNDIDVETIFSKFYSVYNGNRK